MFTKATKKKHKTFDDGMVQIEGKTIILKDLTGKILGKSIQFPLSTLRDLKEGSSLQFAGFEVEITEKMDSSFVTSGKLFEQGNQINTIEETKPNVLKMGLNKVKGSDVKDLKPLVPLHSPSSPNALILYHAKETEDKSGNRVVDVVVDPLLSRYMRPHQREGVQFMYNCVMGFQDGLDGTGCILADEMGLGKTLQVITLIWTMLRQGPFGKPTISSKKMEKVIIVTPVSLIQNWKKEIGKWLGDFRMKSLTVSESSPKEVVETIETFKKSSTDVYPILIISYEKFRQHSELLSTVNTKLLICDEGHRLKNSTIKTTQALMSVQTKNRIIVTGTPIQNDLDEFYAMCDFCNPGTLSNDQTEFKKVFANPILRSRETGASSKERLEGETKSKLMSEVTSKFIIRRTSEILTKFLPSKMEEVIMCSLSPLQKAAYNQFLNLKNEDIEKGAADALSCITTLKKLSNHPSFVLDQLKEMDVDIPEDYDEDSFESQFSGKLSVLEDLLKRVQKMEEKVVLVSNYTKTLDMFESTCNKNGYTFLRLDGKTPNDKRQGLVDKFNVPDGGIFLFLLSTKAGGVGLNLIGANRLVLFDSDWNPAHDRQAMARIWRDGQKKNVFIYRLLSTGTIDEKIFQRQITKQGLSNSVVDGKANEKKAHFTKEELRDLFSYNSDTICDTHDLLQCKKCGIHIEKKRKKNEESSKALESEFEGWTHSHESASCDVTFFLFFPS
eukprot:TRINITY_DN4455_c0_g2_i2.p1 TRINITY_DN4455_c0_g2~~TRINITY_DN4455_c0_g2_i2.p1  ORF type:complete len:842 (-),score=232.18 TRINITY_DN4455_c0_g2_i2:126-2303(-)